jgi:HlyD family secretion protein
MQQIFRADALERLRNPERLDTLMEVTTVKAWIGLAAIATVIAAGVAWSIVGRLPDTVLGRGVLVRQGGLYAVQSLGGGAVLELRAPLGSAVKQGDIIARVAQPDLDLSIRRLESQLDATRRNRDDINGRLDRSAQIEVASLDRQRRQLDQTVEDVQARITYLDERVNQEGRARDLGLVTGDVYQQTLARRAEARDQLVAAQVQRDQLAGRKLDLQTDAVRQLFALDAQIRDLQGQLALARRQLQDHGAVRSPYDGVVVEQLVSQGETVVPGQTIVNVEFASAPLEVLLFTSEGKRVTPGMRVQLLPNGIQAEEDGYILGRVRSVSPAPLSPTAMNRYLRNEALVARLTEAGPLYLVDTEPMLDSTTPSGLRWTTRRGPDLRLGSGALLSGKVTVGAQAPIALVIPSLRKWLGV